MHSATIAFLTVSTAALTFLINSCSCWIEKKYRHGCKPDQLPYPGVSGINMCFHRHALCNHECQASNFGYDPCLLGRRHCGVKAIPPTSYDSFHCVDRYIPMYWMCDGTVDCPNDQDERECLEHHLMPNGYQELINKTRHKLKDESTSRVLSDNSLSRLAVTLFFSEKDYFSGSERGPTEMKYKLIQSALSRILKEYTTGGLMSTADLALYINALLATCTNPSYFYDQNLVERLRRAVDFEEAPHPFLLLVLCNSGETMSEIHIRSLMQLFDEELRTSTTEMRAFSLMALACVTRTDNLLLPNVTLENVTSTSISHANQKYLTTLADNLKDSEEYLQSVHVTALIMQGLFALGDSYVWDTDVAIQYFMDNYKSESFRSSLNDYYVFPSLRGSSLLDINSSRCHFEEDKYKFDVIPQRLDDKQIRVKVTLRTGDNPDVIRARIFTVAEKSTLLDVMKVASFKDPTYKFEYINRTVDHAGDIHIYQIGDLQEDVESGNYWITCRDDIPLSSNPSEISVEDREEYVMWYRAASAFENNANQTLRFCSTDSF